MDSDPFFVKDGDLVAARPLVATVESARPYLYPGNQHLFADARLPSYDKDAAALLKQRVLHFLAGLQEKYENTVSGRSTLCHEFKVGNQSQRCVDQRCGERSRSSF
jgi:hypothetical protein